MPYDSVHGVFCRIPAEKGESALQTGGAACSRAAAGKEVELVKRKVLILLFLMAMMAALLALAVRGEPAAPGLYSRTAAVVLSRGSSFH